MIEDGEKDNTSKKKKVKTARRGTLVPWKESARVRTQGTFKGRKPSGGKVASSEKVEGREEEEEKEKKKGEAQKKENVRSAHQKSVYDEKEEGKQNK